jgi:hypothetical protein
MSASVAFIVEEFSAVERNTLRGFARVRMPSGTLRFHRLCNQCWRHGGLPRCRSSCAARVRSMAFKRASATLRVVRKGASLDAIVFPPCCPSLDGTSTATARYFHGRIMALARHFHGPCADAPGTFHGRMTVLARSLGGPHAVTWRSRHGIALPAAASA